MLLAMGKKQHGKDRMFITKTKWATEWGGAKSKELSTPFKRLPFYCCALTFTPFEDAVCTRDGSVFELMRDDDQVLNGIPPPQSKIPDAIQVESTPNRVICPWGFIGKVAREENTSIAIRLEQELKNNQIMGSESTSQCKISVPTGE
ncbi:hypothetical protein GIB67_027722 [Kingdonia uniflora]|uniref:Uncharacterized protein n=1 Tax=Kingdonia uniflora TaxID=39325 RepID=A0A7J7NLS6_9MAGN|nr:hypothetical protein GIB67_027722 [Kingdonia uniflora]